jgi:hypothetical protein
MANNHLHLNKKTLKPSGGLQSIRYTIKGALNTGGIFYKTGIGKMNPETFYCIKEKQPNREISSLEVDGAVITDPEEII